VELSIVEEVSVVIAAATEAAEDEDAETPAAVSTSPVFILLLRALMDDCEKDGSENEKTIEKTMTAININLIFFIRVPP